MSHLTLGKLKESFKLVNSIHFLLLHTLLFIAILNQEEKQLSKHKSISKATRPLLEIFKATSSFKMQLWYLPNSSPEPAISLERTRYRVHHEVIFTLVASKDSRGKSLPPSFGLNKRQVLYNIDW